MTVTIERNSRSLKSCGKTISQSSPKLCPRYMFLCGHGDQSSGIHCKPFTDRTITGAFLPAPMQYVGFSGTRKRVVVLHTKQIPSNFLTSCKVIIHIYTQRYRRVTFKAKRKYHFWSLSKPPTTHSVSVSMVYNK